MSEEKRDLALGPVLPLVTANQAAENWRCFEELKEKILGNEDYQLIQSKRFIKRSGFRKIALFFGISDRILKEERVDRPDSSFSWRIVVEAVAKGRTCIGVGACDSRERRFAHVEHDVYATAHTRAKSRAISDMVAGGVVSAEEMIAPEEVAGADDKLKPAPSKPTLVEETMWEPRVPVTKEPLSQLGLRQFPLGKGLQVLGIVNVLEDGSEASLVPARPVAVDDPAIAGFLLNKILAGLAEKTGLEYQLDQDGGVLYAILIRGHLEEAHIKELVSTTRWAFEKALVREEEKPSEF